MLPRGNIDMLSRDDGLGGFKSDLENTLQSEIELLLRAQRNQRITDREKDLNIYRAGSAPPTIEGSRNAVGGLYGNFGYGESSSWGRTNYYGNTSDDELRSHPAYESYYYSQENVNPRLPAPLMSKEDWRVTQRFQAGGSSIGDIGDLRKSASINSGESSSLFSLQPGGSGVLAQEAENELMELRKASRQVPTQWLGREADRVTGTSGSGIGSRRKSFADIVQDGLDRTVPLSGHPSRPRSRNAITEHLDASHGAKSIEGLRSGTTSPSLARVSGRVSPVPSSFSSVAPNGAINMNPESHVIARPSSTGLPPVDSRVVNSDRKNVVGPSFPSGHAVGTINLDDVTALSNLSISRNRHASEKSLPPTQLYIGNDNRHDFSYKLANGYNQSVQQQLIEKLNASKITGSSSMVDMAITDRSREIGMNQFNFPRRASSSASLHPSVNSSIFESLEGPDTQYPQGAENVHSGFIGDMAGGYPVDRKPNLAFDNSFGAGSALGLTGNGDEEIFPGRECGVGNDLNSSVIDPLLVQYLQRNSAYARQTPVDPADFPGWNDIGSLTGDLDGLKNVYLEALLAREKQQQDLAILKSAMSSDMHQGNRKYGAPLPYIGNATANSGLAASSYGNSMLHSEQVARLASMMRSSVAAQASIGSWPTNAGSNIEGKFSSSLLDEFKNNKTRSFELSDIFGHVVEFSSDQYGSRFIQQKLETATEEEKKRLFPEIIPHARALMTDVFGNYVIQKFFEHGTESQRRELANQLIGHILPLSLQMYGCRVIQKALEVVDVDQQTQMVSELDGSVMKCVRDQNGNHVVQKCIERVPQDRIQFIISAFYGQVVTLSTHPYGCRVIQRVLEHCDEPKTQEIIMEEIMQSVCALAQDQYGNYVIQHILEHGKSHERSVIITKLAGQIVKMSQQKFASNVIEKCLTFGSPQERQLLIKEMLGSTDENEPLQAMMRDPFGNYVVQKVLETCDDKSLEFILSRIKVHLNTLKRYTYGKHIVSRVEKLIATGERRIGLSSSVSS